MKKVCLTVAGVSATCFLQKLRCVGIYIKWSGPRSHSDRSGAHFAKAPKLFGRIMGALSQRERIEARNFAVILILVPFTTYEKTSFTEQAGRIFTYGFSDSRETGAY